MYQHMIRFYLEFISHDLHINTILLFLSVMESGFFSTLDISFRAWDSDHEFLLKTFAIAVCEKLLFSEPTQNFSFAASRSPFLEFYSNLHRIS